MYKRKEINKQTKLITGRRLENQENSFSSTQNIGSDAVVIVVVFTKLVD